MVDCRDPRWRLLRSKMAAALIQNGCCTYSKNGCCEVTSGRIPKQQNLLKIGAALLAVDT
jgi:hypothetical protein